MTEKTTRDSGVIIEELKPEVDLLKKDLREGMLFSRAVIAICRENNTGPENGLEAFVLASREVGNYLLAHHPDLFPGLLRHSIEVKADKFLRSLK